MSDRVAIESFEDFLGFTVYVGDFVVYATTSGRSPVQKYAMVEGIYEKTKQEYRYNRETDKYDYATVKTTQVGVRELQNGRGFRRFDSYNWKTREAKQVRVTYPMPQNIVLIKRGERR